MKAHPHGSLPVEAFMERNGFWMALYPKDYNRVIQPTARSDEVSRKTKTAIMSLLSASSCRLPQAAEGKRTVRSGMRDGSKKERHTSR